MADVSDDVSADVSDDVSADVGADVSADVGAGATFDDLEINENVLRGVYTYGFEKPSAIQSKSIPKIISGKDIIAQAQSGTGKTGSFAIGTLSRVDETKRATQVLILVPTRELAEQVFNVIKELSPLINGSGGGQSFYATGGGTNVDGIDSVISEAEKIISQI